MKSLTTRHWILIALLILLVAPLSVASAQGPGSGDKVIFGGSFTLESGETLRGDLVVFGGSANTESRSTVRGDITVIGGSVAINGRVRGDVAVIGGALKLGPDAVIEGDSVNFGGSISRSPNAVVEGDSISGPNLGDDDGTIVIPLIPDIPDFEFEDGFAFPDDNQRSPRGGFGSWFVTYFLGGMSAIAMAAILAALGVLIIVLAPRQTERVAETAENNFAVTFGAGLLVALLAVPVIVLLAVTICLSPLAFIIALVLIVAMVFGWLAMGWIIGKHLLKALKTQSATPVMEMVVGVAALTLIWRMPALIPCIGWVVSAGIGVVLGSIGLGSVLLTRFGTREYVRNGKDSAAATSDVAVAEEEHDMPQEELYLPHPDDSTAQEDDDPIVLGPPKDNGNGTPPDDNPTLS